MDLKKEEILLLLAAAEALIELVDKGVLESTENEPNDNFKNLKILVEKINSEIGLNNTT